MVSAGALHDLTQSDAHPLSLFSILCVEACLENRQDLRQNPLTKFLHYITQSTCRYL